MNRKLTLTGKNSNEVYYISYPKNLLIFLKYDFTVFMERSIDLCRMYMKTGEYHPEEVSEVRNSIISCHKYVEQNIRGIFEKLVVDCWIEYICRQNEIGVVTLWNNFIPCKNDFEKAVFSRLCEYRHNFAINQWVNLLKIQEYAVSKADFVFGAAAKNPKTAAARVNYFDLMFNVTANEMGFDLSGVAENKVFNMGRIPNSPMVMRNISREIIRNVLSDVKFLEDNKFKTKKGEFAADQTAMDAFSAVKQYIPSENDNIVETMIKSMNEVPRNVYIPAGLKAVVDLEIDALIESGAVLQRCKRCREYFTRDADYDNDYCDRVSREGRSCLDIMDETEKGEKVTDVPVDASLLSMRCDWLYKEMSARVNVDITQRDFTDWYKYLMLIRDNVINGKATMNDFESFVDYSLSINFNQQKINMGENPVKQNESVKPPKSISNPFVIQKNSHNDFPAPSYNRHNTAYERERDKDREKEKEKDKEVKPFIFEKIDRRSIDENEFVSSAPPERSFTAIQPPPSVSSKVIRGVSPVAYSLSGEKDFNKGVTIPYGSDNYEKPKNQTPIAGAKSVSAIKNNDYEEDVKIYDIDVVKVFEPKNVSKPKRAEAFSETVPEKRRFHPLSIRRDRGREERVETERPQRREAPRIPGITANTDTNSSVPRILKAPNVSDTQSIPKAPVINVPNIPDMSDNKNTHEMSDINNTVETSDRYSRESSIINKKQHAVSAYRSTGVHQNAEPVTRRSARNSYDEPVKNVSRNNEPERDKSGNLWETGESKNIADIFSSAGIKSGDKENEKQERVENSASKPIEHTQELSFNNILKSIEGKDGFRGEQDTDGVPVSHKTKRVMDAIFKPTKATMFFNSNKNGEE